MVHGAILAGMQDPLTLVRPGNSHCRSLGKSEHFEGSFEKMKTTHIEGPQMQLLLQEPDKTDRSYEKCEG